MYDAAYDSRNWYPILFLNWLQSVATSRYGLLSKAWSSISYFNIISRHLTRNKSLYKSITA